MVGESYGGVHGQSYVSLLVDGKSLPVSPGLIRSIHILENTFSIPSAVIIFVDRNNVLRDKHAIVDGTQLSITMGSTLENAETSTFATIAVKEYDEDGLRVLRVVAAINANKFIYDTAGFSLRGSSVQALKKICDTCGLTLDSNVQTDDNMLWLSAAQSPKRFMHEIEQHMWISDEALPKVAITADKRMVVRDVNAELIKQAQYVLCFNVEHQGSELPIKEFRPKSSSGVMNGISNYGDTLMWNSSDGKTNELKGVTVAGKDPLNVNSDIREGIVGTRQAYARPTADINLHKNFQQAYYNWKRQSMAYTETARALYVGGVSGIPLLSCVEAKASFPLRDGNGNMDVKTSGNWIVIGRTKSIVQNSYAETFLLARNFTPVKGETNIGGGKNILNVPVQTVANILRPFQINSALKQAMDGTSAIDRIFSNHELRLNVMMDQFKMDSDIFSFPELAEKYGEGADFLNSLMQEFSMARFLTGICDVLNSLEKLSINMAIDFGPTILSALANRIDQMEGLLNGFTSDINGLIANGDIPDYYMGGPQFSQSCVSNKLEDLQRAVKDELPDKCLDASSISKLFGPSTNLSQLIRQAEENLRNLLCSMGDGTVDGSSKFGAPNGQKLSMYLPRAGA